MHSSYRTCLHPFFESIIIKNIYICELYIQTDKTESNHVQEIRFILVGGLLSVRFCRTELKTIQMNWGYPAISCRYRQIFTKFISVFNINLPIA